MSKKSKRNKHHSATNPNQDSGQQHQNGGNVRVHGAVEVNLAPSLIEHHNTERNEDRAHDNKNYILGKLTLIAVVIYALFTLWQGCLTRKLVGIAQQTYDTSQRPFVGVNGVQPIYVWFDNGIMKTSTLLTKETTQLDFRAEIKNFGPTPGMNFRGTWKILFGGVEQNLGHKIPDRPHTIFPGQSIILSGGVGGEDYHAIVRGDKTLDILVTIDYDGTEHYSDCEKYQYAVIVNGFWNLGACQ